MKKKKWTKEEKYEIKKLIFFQLIISLIFPVFVLSISQRPINLEMLLFIWCNIAIMFVPIILKEYIKAKTTVDFYINEDEFFREIPKEVPPAIASVLVDLNIEIKQDYLATVANLISKKYIEVNLNETEQVTVKNSDLSKLMEHERFAFNCVVYKMDFNAKEFENKIIADAKNLNLIKKLMNKEKLKKIFWKHIIACVIFCILLVCAYYGGLYLMIKFNFNKVVIFTAVLLEAILLYMVYKSKTLSSFYSKQIRNPDFNFIYERTPKGIEYAEKFQGLKNYFNQYTIIKYKDLEDINLYEDYIAYAIALGEANKLDTKLKTDYYLADILGY